MKLAHVTLPTQHVERTAAFFEETLGLEREPLPSNSPVDVVWLGVGGGQTVHIFYVEGFEVSAFENEFGRHIALYAPYGEFPALKARLTERGAEVFDSLRPTPYARFFFRETINGYVVEVIADP
jgi:catechol 2,3-dioxygenase-like lactoylglutathione lyase family enzyme